jgi:hypothetical protein
MDLLCNAVLVYLVVFCFCICACVYVCVSPSRSHRTLFSHLQHLFRCANGIWLELAISFTGARSNPYQHVTEEAPMLTGHVMLFSYITCCSLLCLIPQPPPRPPTSKCGDLEHVADNTTRDRGARSHLVPTSDTPCGHGPRLHLVPTSGTSQGLSSPTE